MTMRPTRRALRPSPRATARHADASSKSPKSCASSRPPRSRTPFSEPSGCDSVIAALGAGRKPKAGCVEFRGLAVGIVLGVLMAAAPARAQLTLQVPAEPPGPLVREAFTSAYGKALADELGEALRDAPDPACLDSKRLKAAQLRPPRTGLMSKWGTRMLESSASLIDSKVYESKLAEAGGRNASAELARLTDDADVKRYREIERPIRLTAVLDAVFA